jgi:predicted transcriptional regulator
MEKKITKKEMFAQVIAMAQGKEVSVSADEIVAFAEHEIELLNKKAGTKSKKETANDAENARLMEVIVETLTGSEKAMTVSELMTANAELGELSNQKVSALMKKLVDGGRVQKSTDKRKSVFSI